MASTGRFEVTAFLLLGLALFSCLASGEVRYQTSLNGAEGGVSIANHNFTLISGRRLLGDSGGKKRSGGGASGGGGGEAAGLSAGAAVANGAFVITAYGAKADGKTDSAQAFQKAWQAACAASKATVLVPKGSFMTSPVIFGGPCKGPITFTNQGTVIASTDLSTYVDATWLLFQKVNGLTINGGGTFDGQGASAWPYNDCKQSSDCGKLPSSIKFQRVSNGVISGITSLNSKHFHFHITDSSNIKADGLTITAPGNSPNTDGMHLSDTSGITVTKTKIGTGDDCISIGAGVTDATFTGITCGPGHGLSVGSLGKYKDEKPVKGITFQSCTISGTTNGARIKSYGNSPPGEASGITFSDITMNNVENPIVIDQNYNTHGTSKVKISDVHFKNIKGTSKTPVSIMLDCSPGVPCEGVELSNINLRGTATCKNAKTTSTGPSLPACK